MLSVRALPLSLCHLSMHPMFKGSMTVCASHEAETNGSCFATFKDTKIPGAANVSTVMHVILYKSNMHVQEHSKALLEPSLVQPLCIRNSISKKNLEFLDPCLMLC